MAALNSTLFHELNAALRTLSTDDATGCVVLTGSDKAFAAGADIKEMKDKQFAEVYKGDFLAHWTELSGFRKPIVAAVSGYAVSRPRFALSLLLRAAESGDGTLRRSHALFLSCSSAAAANSR